MAKNKQGLIDAIHRLSAGEITVTAASLISGYSATHIRNVLRKYKVRGDSVFINGHKGMRPHNKIPLNTCRSIVANYKERFEGFNFRFFCKIMNELDNFNISYKTIYNILTAAGIVSPENKRKPKPQDIHRPRARRVHEGELLQIDATPYQWFAWCGDNKYYSIHGAIDDATGKITALYMCDNECLYGYTELIRRTFFNFPGGGHPAAIYSDRAAIFCYTPRDKDKLTISEQLKGLHEKRTQWQRMLSEINVDQILAWSPQAKGRVERMWRTVQGRLPWYFKDRKISTVEEANKFLLEYVDIFNREFSVDPVSPIAVWHKTGLDPDYVLSARYDRTLRNGEFFSFEGYRWRIPAKLKTQKFELCVNEHGIRAYHNGKFYDVEFYDNFCGETTTQVLENIIFKYFLKDMKEVAA